MVFTFRLNKVAETTKTALNNGIRHSEVQLVLLQTEFHKHKLCVVMSVLFF